MENQKLKNRVSVVSYGIRPEFGDGCGVKFVEFFAHFQFSVSGDPFLVNVGGKDVVFIVFKI
jgi:hypothetical protein